MWPTAASLPDVLRGLSWQLGGHGRRISGAGILLHLLPGGGVDSLPGLLWGQPAGLISVAGLVDVLDVRGREI
jgi:hypothetical protein